MLSPVRPRDASACVSWSLRLPSKLKIFACLTDIDRLSTRANLFYKNCTPSDVCAACPAVESGRHLFFDSHLVANVWSRLDVPIPARLFSIWDLQPHLAMPNAAWHMGVAAIPWSIWRSRNDLVFNGRPSTSSSALRRVCDDLALWRWRLPITTRAALDVLRSYMLARAT
jgi:hypothetical protein